MQSSQRNISFDVYPERLTVAKENQLAKRGTERAHITLAMHSMREAMKYTKRCCRDSISEPELASLCYVTLLRSAARFKPDWARFFAFSKAYLRGAIREHFTKLKTVKKSDTTSRECLEQAIAVSRKREDDEPDDIEVHTGECVEPDFRLVSLREKWSLVEPILNSCLLSDHEKMIIDLTYKSGFTFKSTAAKLGTSPSAIQSAHAAALRKIRCKLLADHRLFDDY